MQIKATRKEVESLYNKTYESMMIAREFSKARAKSWVASNNVQLAKNKRCKLLVRSDTHPAANSNISNKQGSSQVYLLSIYEKVAISNSFDARCISNRLAMAFDFSRMISRAFDYQIFTY